MSAPRLSIDDRRLLELLCEGLIDKQISVVLGLKVAAVASRVTSLREVFGARNRAHLVHLVHRAGALDMELPPPPKEPVRVPWDRPDVLRARRNVLVGLDERKG